MLPSDDNETLVPKARAPLGLCRLVPLLQVLPVRVYTVAAPFESLPPPLSPTNRVLPSDDNETL